MILDQRRTSSTFGPVSASPMNPTVTAATDTEPEARRRFSLALTQEGWIFLVVLLFISAGALLRNINLLMLLSGIMIAPLLLSWRLTRKMMQQVTARRSVPTRLFAQAPAVITWHLANQRPRLPSWMMVVRDHWQLSNGDERANLQVPIQLLYPTVAPQSLQSLGYRIHFPSRGRFAVGPAVVSTRFPLGLMEYRLHLPQCETFRVAPALGQLSATWDRRLLSHASGNHAMQRKRGFQDEEFYALRPWRSGDSARDIHWRSTARQNYPMVRQYDTRSDRDFVMILDLNTRAPSGQLEPAVACEIILSFAATLVAQLSTQVKGKIGFAICGRETVVMCEYASGAFFDQLFGELADAQFSSDTQAGMAAIELSQAIPGGTPYYVVSPLGPYDLSTGIPADIRARFQPVEPWVRWLDLDSAEFHSLFSPPAALVPGGSPTANGVTTGSQKWSTVPITEPSGGGAAR